MFNCAFQLMQPTFPATGKQAPRVGNLGHLTRIANKLVQLGSYDNRIQGYLEVSVTMIALNLFLIRFMEVRDWGFLSPVAKGSEALNVWTYYVYLSSSFLKRASWWMRNNSYHTNTIVLSTQCSKVENFIQGWGLVCVCVLGEGAILWIFIIYDYKYGFIKHEFLFSWVDIHFVKLKSILFFFFKF